jgi:hypothetical protein
VSVFDEQHREIFTKYAKTKAAAIRSVKQDALPWAVRGLLCRRCNRGLGYIERFFNAAAYPENLLPVIEYLKSRLTSK